MGSSGVQALDGSAARMGTNGRGRWGFGDFSHCTGTSADNRPGSPEDGGTMAPPPRVSGGDLECAAEGTP